LQDRNARRQKDEELLEIVPVGDADLVEAGQIGHQDRQGRLQPIQ
jgi:hypothetical protein